MREYKFRKEKESRIKFVDMKRNVRELNLKVQKCVF